MPIVIRHDSPDMLMDLASKSGEGIAAANSQRAIENAARIRLAQDQLNEQLKQNQFNNLVKMREMEAAFDRDLFDREVVAEKLLAGQKRFEFEQEKHKADLMATQARTDAYQQQTASNIKSAEMRQESERERLEMDREKLDIARAQAEFSKQHRSEQIEVDRERLAQQKESDAMQLHIARMREEGATRRALAAQKVEEAKAGMKLLSEQDEKMIDLQTQMQLNSDIVPQDSPFWEEAKEVMAKKSPAQFRSWMREPLRAMRKSDEITQNRAKSQVVGVQLAKLTDLEKTVASEKREHDEKQVVSLLLQVSSALQVADGVAPPARRDLEAVADDREGLLRKIDELKQRARSAIAVLHTTNGQLLRDRREAAISGQYAPSAQSELGQKFSKWKQGGGSR